MKNNKINPIIIAAPIMFLLIVLGVTLTRHIGSSQKTVNRDAAQSKLEKYVKKIGPVDGTPVRGTLEYTDEDTTYQELPELTDSSIAVKPTSQLYAEIFASSEKTGSGMDGYLKDMATKFNNTNTQINGQPVSVMIRTVASGQQVDYVSSGKYVPTAISPSSTMSIEMLNAKGVETEYATKSLVKNYAGIVVSKSAYSTLMEEYNGANIQAVAKATADGKLNFGYTNPFTSATGLNFLITLLDSYSSGNILSESAKNEFGSFQKNVPFVAMTTGQMRNAAEKGALDAFVMEYQTYVTDMGLSKNYTFIPFGYVHENPLAIITGQYAGKEKEAIVKEFVEYCEANGQDLAKKDGFNIEPEGYIGMSKEYTGQELISAQKFYKENKDSNPVCCVFITDVSGSMAGEPLNTLKSSLINSMQYINSENYIGLVSYSDNVTIELPISQFDMTQQTYFKGTVESLSEGGATATYDAVCVGLDMIEKKLAEDPNLKPMIFVLSDGEANRGYGLNEIEDVVLGLQIPVYTIGYNANIDKLKKLAEINEGVCIDASTDDVTYQLKQLFNANM